jgi:hypothetical protein
MKTLLFLITLATISIFIQSCKKEPAKIILTDDYLPLEVGNFWQLENTEKEEIIGTKIINNKTYFILAYQSDTTYYSSENNKIYVIENNKGKSLKFDLTARVHDTWKFNLYNVTLSSRTDSVIINNHKIYNCLRFYFDIPVYVDDEYSIWLAPGIGFIQEMCGECIYPLRKLNVAKIGDQNIDF